MAALNQNFRESLQSLNAHNVDYLIVGGFAVGFHGRPRATGDIDIWVRRSMENAKKLLKAIDQFGFPIDQLSKQDFLKKDQFVQIGRPPQRIDLISSMSGVEFDECFSKRETAEIDGLKLPFIGLEDLKQSKRASGRYIDLDDLEYL